MSKYKINPEGEAMLRKVAKESTDSLDELKQAGTDLQSAVDGAGSGRGPHASSIESIVQDLLDEIKEAEEPIQTMADVLNEVADDYAEMIANDRYKKSGN